MLNDHNLLSVLKSEQIELFDYLFIFKINFDSEKNYLKMKIILLLENLLNIFIY